MAMSARVLRRACRRRLPILRHRTLLIITNLYTRVQLYITIQYILVYTYIYIHTHIILYTCAYCCSSARRDRRKTVSVVIVCVSGRGEGTSSVFLIIYTLGYGGISFHHRRRRSSSSSSSYLMYKHFVYFVYIAYYTVYTIQIIIHYIIFIYV